MTRFPVVSVAVLAVAGACITNEPAAVPDQETIDKLTITTEPRLPSQTVTAGTTVSLGLAGTRDASLYVPASYDRTKPTAYVLLLNRFVTSELPKLRAQADSHAVVLLFVSPRLATQADGPIWDFDQTGMYGPDVEFINDAIDAMYDRINVHPSDAYVMGLSGGGAYALALGAANAGLFRRIAAFSPRGLFIPYARGYPPIFVADGTGTDSWYQTRDSTVPRLRQMGFLVEFSTYQGGALPDSVLSRGFKMLLER